jgi:uncharacterized protein (DUF342 family)
MTQEYGEQPDDRHPPDEDQSTDAESIIDDESAGDAARDSKIPIEVKLDRERMTAWLIIRPGVDPADLTSIMILQIVRERGVKIDAQTESKLDEAIASFLETNDVTEVVIAKGSPPAHGADGDLVWLDQYDPSCAHNRVSTDEDGAVDFYNLVSYVSVKPGDRVALLTPPTDGEDGLDVTGSSVPARPGRALDVKVDQTLSIDGDGAVIAQSSGVLEYRDNCIRIVRLMEINDNVDFSTGNIDFDGSITVRHGVKDCFVIKASEDVTVDGLVEAATIIAGGNIFIRRGMAARDNGELLCDGDAHIGYINNARGRIRGNLFVRREIMDCSLIVGGSVIADQAAIVGGRLVASRDVHVAALGSAGGTPTTLVLSEAPFIALKMRRLRAIERELRMELERKREKFEELSTSKARFSAAEKESLTEFTFEISDAEHKLEYCGRKREDFEEQARAVRMVDLHVSKTIYSRVAMRIGWHNLNFIESVQGPIHITWDDRFHVVYARDDGVYRPISEIAIARNAAA